MLVDPVTNTSNRSTSTPTNMNDLEEYLNTELFGSSSSMAPMSPGPSGSSRASSPSSHSDSLSQILSTPPQPVESSFPDPYSFLNGLSGADGNHNFGFGYGGGSGAPSFFNFMDEEMKVDPSSSSMSFETGTPFDFMSALGIGGVSGLTIDPSASSSSGPGSGSVALAIDPQLVDSPSTHCQSDFGDSEDKEEKMEDAIVSIIDEKKTRSQYKAPSSKTSEDAADVTKESKEKLTVTIAPVKVGGHGKARKGTVQGGGVTKKVATSTSSTVPVAALSVPLPVVAATSPSPTYFPSTSASSLLSRNKENVSAASPSSSTTSNAKVVDDKEEDDDLPADWRPPPEVFARMSSKEKRQLRNKISARNFRVRRKEYINTLEMDIAERDRLLQAIRSELGSTQSENLALRQEVAALKKALLDGRGATGASSLSPSSASSVIRSTSPALSIRGADVNLNSAAVVTGLTIDDLNLPPPAPLPERSAAEELALRAAVADAPSSVSNVSTASNLLVPNTQKDLPTSPRLSNAAGFWGGVSQAGFGFGGIGSGFTPVHTVLMPDLNTNLNVGGTNMSIGQWVRDVLAANAANSREGSSSPEGSPRPLQENMNPVMNEPGAHHEENTSGSTGTHSGFDGFVDTNPFTMKTLDAYRMQLWTKMAASSSQAFHSNQFSPPQQFSQSNPHSSTYAQQRKALERELSSASPFTLPSHQPGPKHPHSHHPNSLTTSLKPAYFVNSNKPNLPSTPPPRMGNTLSALLAGKHSTASIFGGSFSSSSPSSQLSPNLGRAAPSKQQQQQMQQAQNFMYAALADTATQTLMRRLGNAFWDAFSGSSSSSSSTSGSHANMKPWDADKVRRVLEGKAVIKVVDVDEPVQHAIKRELMTPMRTSSSSSSDCDKSCSMTALLEESMRSLTLGKK